MKKQKKIIYSVFVIISVCVLCLFASCEIKSTTDSNTFANDYRLERVYDEIVHPKRNGFVELPGGHIEVIGKSEDEIVYCNTNYVEGEDGTGSLISNYYQYSLDEKNSKPVAEEKGMVTIIDNYCFNKTIFYKGIMPSEKILDLPVNCNFLTGSVNL